MLLGRGALRDKRQVVGNHQWEVIRCQGDGGVWDGAAHGGFGRKSTQPVGAEVAAVQCVRKVDAAVHAALVVGTLAGEAVVASDVATGISAFEAWRKKIRHRVGPDWCGGFRWFCFTCNQKQKIFVKKYVLFKSWFEKKSCSSVLIALLVSIHGVCNTNFP